MAIHNSLVKQLDVSTDMAWIGDLTSLPRTAEDARKLLAANAMAQEAHIHALANHFTVSILVVSIAKKADYLKIMHYEPGYLPARALTKLQFKEVMDGTPAPVTLGFVEAAKHFVTLGPPVTRPKRKHTAGASIGHEIVLDSD